MSSILKPEFLPFKELPVPREDCIQAGSYLMRLEIENGHLSSNEILTALVGQPWHFELTKEQRGIVRRVSRVIASEIPPTRKYDPVKILSILERA